MSDKVKLSELRTRCLERADMEGSTFMNVAAQDDRINHAIKRWRDMLTLHRGADYYAKRATITTVSGTTAYALPEDFMALLGLVSANGTLVYPMASFDLSQMGAVMGREAGGGVQQGELRYRLLDGDSIEIRPAPAGAYALTVSYLPTYPILTDASDELDSVNGWDEWIVLTVAIGYLDKEESDSRSLRAERAELEAAIKAMAASRDMSQAPRIRRTRRRNEGRWQE